MIFTALVLISAFLIEGIGTFVSVLGLSSLFSANIIVIALAISLDIAKVVSVSFLYKYWTKINLVMKSYMTIASIILMIITSAGAFGFLSAEFQKAISGTNSQNILITSLEEEQLRLQKRKEDIDKQVSQLPENNVRGRMALMRQFSPEVSRLNARLGEIDTELPKLKLENVKKNVEVGPIIFIAEAFNTTPEHAVKWIILVIILVFDPLAVALLIAGNFLIENRKNITVLPTVISEDIVANTIAENVQQKLANIEKTYDDESILFSVDEQNYQPVYDLEIENLQGEDDIDFYHDVEPPLVQEDSIQEDLVQEEPKSILQDITYSNSDVIFEEDNLSRSKSNYLEV